MNLRRWRRERAERRRAAYADALFDHAATHHPAGPCGRECPAFRRLTAAYIRASKGAQ